MKSFFKKIGKGLKKLGKGIMKIMSSKIGRVIGMVSLAFGIGSIFKAMFEGVGKAATQSLVQEGGKEAINVAGETAAEEAAKNIVTETSKESAIKMGEKLTGKIGAEATGEAVVSNLGEAVDVINSVKDNVLKLGGDTNAASMTENATKTIDLTTKKAAEGTVSKAATTEFTAKSVLENAPQEVASLDPNSMASKVLNSSPADYAANAETLASGYTPPPEYTNVAQENLQAFQDMKPSELRDFLKNPENRALYEDLSAIPESKLTEAGQLRGVQEFSSFKDAWKSGDSLLNKTGNVFERVISYDVGELTKGSVKGYAGNLPVIATTQKAASLLAGSPEVVTPAMPNRYAPSIVADLQSQGSMAMYEAPSPSLDFTNQISRGANPYQAMSSIRQNAGFSNIYGSLNSLASV